ncbi:radical SAM protein [bacterium]|nr:radical SAM protein [bacterium]
MKYKLLETPSIYCREESAIVIFPSIPYWFAASKEVELILGFFDNNSREKVVKSIAMELLIEKTEAISVCDTIQELLYNAGVLEINGSLNSKRIKAFSPNFQVNKVENVLVISTTQYCNLKCPMCYAMSGKRFNYEITKEQVIDIVNQVDGMNWENKISRIALTGGELFSRNDALELIEYISNKGFFVQVNTNATLFSEKDIKKLSEIKNLHLSISLDGSCLATHEFIRGKNTFVKTVRNIKRLCKLGVNVGVNMLVHGGNIFDIKPTLELAKKLGVRGFNCLNVMSVGRGNTNYCKTKLSAVTLSSFYREVYSAIKDRPDLQSLMINSAFANQIMGINAGVKSVTCGIGTNRAMYVKPDGSIYPCADTVFNEFKLGNLLEDNLYDIWNNSSKLKMLRSLHIDTMNSICASCDVRYVCAGNCRGENYQTTFDLKSPHFKCKEIHDSILELMWILTEDPNLFKEKTIRLYDEIKKNN